MSQVQVGCLEHCYGATTLDTSGLTLGQIEQLLGELQVPTPPTPTTAPGQDQDATQQTAAQSQNGDGHQSQSATQFDGTTQVVVTPAGPPADGGTGTAAVNQTAQGIVQVQVGCIFYCTGTQQTQSAQQANATIQTVDGSAAGTVDTVAQGVSQVQVGCVAWCYDASETQTATGTDSTVVDVPPPPDPTTPVIATPPPAGATAPSLTPSPTGGRTRYSGGAAIRVTGDGLGVGRSVTSRPGLVSVAVARIVQTEVPATSTRRVPRRVRHDGRHHRVPRQARAAQHTAVAAAPSVEAGTAAAQPTLELSVLLVLAALAIGVCRFHRVP